MRINPVINRPGLVFFVLLLGWPVIATMLLSGLMAFLFRNDNQFGGI